MQNQSQVWTPHASWGSIGGGTQGGVVAGRLIEAAGVDVRAATVHLLHRVAAEVEATIHVAVDRPGSTRSLRTELHQGGRVVALAQLLAVPLTRGEPFHAAPEDRPIDSPDDGVPYDAMGDLVPFGKLLEIRALGPQRPLGGGADPRLTGWVRLRDAGGLGPLVQLAALADALPPSSFAVLRGPAMLPTVEITIHLVGTAPEPGSWVRLDQRVVAATADTVVDDAEVRDRTGALVALVRQTRRAHPPR